MKKRDCTIRVAKTKALISFAVTAKLICVFVFAYAKSRFSHDEAHKSVGYEINKINYNYNTHFVKKMRYFSIRDCMCHCFLVFLAVSLLYLLSFE